MTKTRTLLLVVAVVVTLIAAWLIVAHNCPSVGFALSTRARNLHRLKNRTAFPQQPDFDSQITLDELLKLGDDTDRWATAKAARIEGHVIDVAFAKIEATNCYSPCRRDIHIVLANRKDAPHTEQVIVEVTPNLRPIFQSGATHQVIDWSDRELKAQIAGRWCEFEGWLYFDLGHAEESENTAPGKPDNWRATAWEIHPVTKIRVIK